MLKESVQAIQPNAGLWARQPKTAGHPPVGTIPLRSGPNGGVTRFNEMGGVGRDRRTPR